MKKLIFVCISLFLPWILTTSDYDVDIYNEDSLCWYQDKYATQRTVISDINRVTATVYEAVPSQTDDTPLHTADGSFIDVNSIPKLRWCAVSRNLLKRWGGPYDYGDTIYVRIPNIDPVWGNDLAHKKFGDVINGYWVIHDTMNKRYKNYIDFLSTPDFVWGKFNDAEIYRIKVKNEEFHELVGRFDYLK
jgi:hypothetical protein